MPTPGPRPLPVRYPEDAPHLDGAARGELRLPHCRSCDRVFWPAGPVCPADFSPDVDWVTDPGDGVVTSWVAFHRAYFADLPVPYDVVQVRLDSGPRLTTTWSGDDDPACGQRARVTFTELRDGVVVPEFGPEFGPAAIRPFGVSVAG